MHWPSFSPYEEERLVARCLRGEDAAWELMFHLYHPRLMSVIKAEMNWHCSTDLAEEIAASIWCSLCSETYSRLRRYDPQVGRLLTYLRALARREIWQKSARRRIADLGNAVPLAARRPRTISNARSLSRNSWTS